MEELDLKELISIFMKRKILIILVIIIFALLGAIYTIKFVVPEYQSTTNLVLVQTGAIGSVFDADTNSITTSDVTLNSKLVENYRTIADSEDVASMVIQKLNLNMSIEELQNITTISTKPDTEIIDITVQYTDPEIACQIASETANSFIEKVNGIYHLNNLNILDKAKVEQEPCNVHLAKNIVIFAFVGAILVSGYILLINMLDTTIKSDKDIERVLDLPVLASIVLTTDTTKKGAKVQNSDLYKITNLELDNEPIEQETTASLFENYDSASKEDEENTEIDIHTDNNDTETFAKDYKSSGRGRNRNRRKNK